MTTETPPSANEDKAWVTIQTTLRPEKLREFFFGLLYFFLFRFFLGETLGDRLFRPRNETPEERD